MGGVSNFTHLIMKYKTTDIHVPRRSIRNLLVVQVYNLGFTTIDLEKKFSYLDIDTIKRQYVTWVFSLETSP